MLVENTCLRSLGATFSVLNSEAAIQFPAWIGRIGVSPQLTFPWVVKASLLRRLLLYKAATKSEHCLPLGSHPGLDTQTEGESCRLQGGRLVLPWLHLPKVFCYLTDAQGMHCGSMTKYTRAAGPVPWAPWQGCTWQASSLHSQGPQRSPGQPEQTRLRKQLLSWLPASQVTTQLP